MENQETDQELGIGKGVSNDVASKHIVFQLAGLFSPKIVSL